MGPVQRVGRHTDTVQHRKVGTDEQRHGEHRPPARALRNAAGAAPGNIIAAIIATHRAMKKEKEPSPPAAPMSMAVAFIPAVCRTVTTQQEAVTASIAVTQTAVGVSGCGSIRESACVPSLLRASPRYIVRAPHLSAWIRPAT